MDMGKNSKVFNKDASKADTSKGGAKPENIKKVRPKKTKKTSRGK
jgi:hypothetical protein